MQRTASCAALSVDCAPAPLPAQSGGAVAVDWRQTHPDLIRRIARSIDQPSHNELFFHGSLETLNGRLKPGCDGMVWFADSPVIAQIYIPATGGFRAVSPYDYLRRDPSESWAPRSEFDEAGIRQAGFDLCDIERNVQWTGSLSWRCRGPRSPTLGDCRRLMVDELGYAADADMWRVRGIDCGGRLSRILPASYRETGTLVVVPRPSDLRLLDLRNGPYGSDMCNSYRYTRTFRQAESDGYDGVIIDDLAQTETYGNLGHYGFGLFSKTANQLPELRIPAQHAEWTRWSTVTPEFAALRSEIRAVDG